MIKIYFVTVFVTMIAACKSGNIEIREETNFPEGRILYLSKCAGCHRLYEKTEFNAMGWDSILTLMKTKAKLNDKQRELIYNYLSESSSHK